MSGFTVEWLDLREPADAAARAASLVSALVRDESRALEVIDLASGTGANLRWLAPRLGGEQHWLAVDHDPALLGALAARPVPHDVTLRPVQLDLAHDLDAVPIAGADLVTASALLDLVSDAWLRRLAERCAAARADVLFTLTYDGRIEWTPRERGDERLRELLNRHQRSDKGFGPALGPGAAQEAEAAFRALGYVVHTAASDWELGPDAQALQRALVDGWLAASIESAPDERVALVEWANRRRGRIDRGESRLVVGHVDLAARLKDSPQRRKEREGSQSD